MKKLFSVAMALIMSFGVFVSAYAQDITTVGPFLIMDNPGSMVVGDEITLTLTSYAANELEDDVITPEDFEISGRSAEIIYVSEADRSFDGSHFTYWTVTVKCVSSGNSKIAIAEGAVSDISGNSNLRIELTEVYGMSRIYYFFWSLWQRIQYFFNHAI